MNAIPAGRRTSDPAKRSPCCHRPLACSALWAPCTHIYRQDSALTGDAREEGILDKAIMMFTSGRGTLAIMEGGPIRRFAKGHQIFR